MNNGISIATLVNAVILFSQQALLNEMTSQWANFLITNSIFEITILIITVEKEMYSSLVIYVP